MLVLILHFIFNFYLIKWENFLRFTNFIFTNLLKFNFNGFSFKINFHNLITCSLIIKIK